MASRILFAALLAAAPWASAGAQTGAQTGGQTRAPAPAPDTCTDVQVGSAQSYACINARLGAVAQGTDRPSSQDAPLNSASPSNAVGSFNEGATRNRLGANFGKSATPYRPPVANPPALPPPR
jgi:hypothetical protein